MQDRSLLDYWVILYEHRITIYLVVATSIISAILIGVFVTPIYEARATLYIPAKLAPVTYVAPTAGSTSSLAREQGAPLAKEVDYKPYLGMLKSVQLAQIVNAKFPTKSVTKLLRSDVDFEVTDELVVRVYSRDPDPQLAADVANAYVEGLNTILTDSSRAQVDREPEYISLALSRISGEMQKAEQELKRFERQNHVTNLEAELTTLSNQKALLQEKADDAVVQVSAIRGKKAALEQELKREARDFESSEVALTSPLIVSLRTQLADALTKLAELELELGGNNLQLQAQRQRKQDIERQLGEEIKRWYSSRIKPDNTHVETLRQQLIDIVIEEQRLEALGKANVRALARLKDRLDGYPDIKARGAELKAGVDRLRKMREQLQLNLNEAQLQNERTMHLVVQLDKAGPPGKPSFPIWWLNMLIGLFVGTLAGLGYAFFLNYVEETRTVRIRRLVQAIVGRDKGAPV